ncbi:uncharacterized protein LOC127869085 isoform X2 [Dreissena polymorpha]|nr:uncharacterized protein LOC127869085 isoform X2 [Dreissena polymorpha]
MQQLYKEIQIILAKLNKFARTQKASIQSLEGSYRQKLQEIREIRKKLNAALDEVENTSLKELNEIRSTLQTPLKENVDNCSRLKDELQKLGEAVQGLGDKSNREIEFIASMKCLDKMEESKEYLMENPITVQSSIIFQANLEIESLGKVIDSMQSLKLKKNPDQVLTVKRKYEYNVRIPSDTALTCYIIGICSLPSGQIIVVDFNNENVKLFDQHYNVSSHCDVSDAPYDICKITSSEVAVTQGGDGVQFVYVSNGQLVNGRKLKLSHKAIGIAHHQGALYITSWTDLYQYTLTGTLVKKLSRPGGSGTVYRCAVSTAGDRIYVTKNSQHKLLTLATDASLISIVTDPELQEPWGVHVTPAGQVLVCGSHSNTVIQVDREGRKKLATLASKKHGAIYPVSVCCNTNMHQIIVGRCNNDKIIVLELQ